MAVRSSPAPRLNDPQPPDVQPRRKLQCVHRALGPAHPSLPRKQHQRRKARLRRRHPAAHHAAPQLHSARQALRISAAHLPPAPDIHVAGDRSRRVVAQHAAGARSLRGDVRAFSTVHHIRPLRMGSPPLFGLLHGAEGRIRHLSVANLSGPLQLIECLQFCRA